jgi:DNA-binding CsgD family transcriptional regulator
MIDEQLELFQSRLPKKPYCTDDLPAGLQVRPQRTATRKRYIQANPPWLRSWLIFDVDRPGAALAWDDAHLPEPIWTSQNRDNGHAHLCWGLDAPVLLGEHDREKPMRYLSAVEAAMRAKLDADPGYSGLVTKNPAHPHWRTLWARSGGLYDLSDLSEWLNLPKFIDRRKKPERVGLGRNVATFDHVRHIAYRSVRGWKNAGKGAFVYYQAHLHDLAQQFTHNEHPSPLDRRECYHIARSVAKWTWTHFDIESSDRRFSELQSYRGKMGGRPAMEDKQASARLLRAQGMTQKAIAQELGVGERSVRSWLKTGKKP